MTQTLDSLVREVESGEQHLTYEVISGRGAQETERVVDGFVSVLRRMTREERISASRHGGFTRWERWYGRLASLMSPARIALNLADNE